MHAIDMTNNRANMAFAGEVPWHGLGQELTPDANIKIWTKEAGLDFEVVPSTITYRSKRNEEMVYPNRRALNRSDNGAPLGLVSDRFKIVQPEDVMKFFGDLAEIGGFQMETAGSLFGGRRIWALAKINDGAPIIDKDIVKPYVLMSTGFDGATPTVAKFTAIRVVCNNTIRMAIGQQPDETGEVRVVHNSIFDAADVRDQLGIADGHFSKWVEQSQALAGLNLSGHQADEVLVEAFRSDQREPEDIRESKTYKAIIALFEGSAIGHTGQMSGWDLLNATTEYYDHHHGRKQDRRLEQAWFGSGDAAKTKIQSILAEVA